MSDNKITPHEIATKIIETDMLRHIRLNLRGINVNCLQTHKIAENLKANFFHNTKIVLDGK